MELISQTASRQRKVWKITISLQTDSVKELCNSTPKEARYKCRRESPACEIRRLHWTEQTLDKCGTVVKIHATTERK